MTPQDKALESVFPFITEAIDQWKAENTREIIIKRVKDMLNKESEEITLKLLGFNKDRWDGSWSLDHCNGRSGNSIAGDYLKTVQAEAIREWLSATVMPTMSDITKKKLQKSMQVEFNNRIHDRAVQQVASNVQTVVDTYLKDIVSYPHADDYIKLQKLLETPTKESTK